MAQQGNSGSGVFRVWGVNARGPHLLKEERQLVTFGGQPLGVQRSVKTQAQSPTRVGRVLQPSFLRRQSVFENQVLSDSEAAPIPQGWGGKGPDVGGGARAQWTAGMSLETTANHWRAGVRLGTNKRHYSGQVPSAHKCLLRG